MESKTLVNGIKIPSICYGTDINHLFKSNSNMFVRLFLYFKFIVKSIIKKDGRFKKEKGIYQCLKNIDKFDCYCIDTSRAYGSSEHMIQKAIKGKDRNELFIITKLCASDQLKGKTAEAALRESMKELGVSYVDLYLIHWPVPGKWLDYWKQLEVLYKKGLCRSIGVSNCKIHHLEELKKTAEIMPMANEIECHPLLTEEKLRKYCQVNNIQILSYTSTARFDFRLRNSRRMDSICSKYNKNLGQIILRWQIQIGNIPIFNTTSVKHLKNNMDIFNFEISKEDIDIISGMNINSRLRYDSDNCEFDKL